MPFYRWDQLAGDTITPKYSTTYGPTVNGEKLSVGLYTIPAGTGAKPHAHPNEQVIAVMKGRMRFRLGQEERVVGPGEVVLIPANTEHQTTALDDVEFFNCKDLVPGFSIQEGGWSQKP